MPRLRLLLTRLSGTPTTPSEGSTPEHATGRTTSRPLGHDDEEPSKKHSECPDLPDRDAGDHGLRSLLLTPAYLSDPSCSGMVRASLSRPFTAGAWLVAQLDRARFEFLATASPVLWRACARATKGPNFRPDECLIAARQPRMSPPRSSGHGRSVVELATTAAQNRSSQQCSKRAREAIWRTVRSPSG